MPRDPLRWRYCGIGAATGLIAIGSSAAQDFDQWIGNWRFHEGAMGNLVEAATAIGIGAMIGYAIGLMKDRRRS